MSLPSRDDLVNCEESRVVARDAPALRRSRLPRRRPLPEAVVLTNGADTARIPRGGWSSPNLAAAADPDERDELSAEDAEALHRLMSIEDVTSAMTRFLGG
jgi:hypothetical protein